MDDTILTLNPARGKQGVRISRAKYDQVRAAIVAALRQHETLTFKELAAAVNTALAGRFEGSITWYLTCVKLDMQARKELTVSGASPQQIRLKAAR